MKKKVIIGTILILLCSKSSTSMAQKKQLIHDPFQISPLILSYIETKNKTTSHTLDTQQEQHHFSKPPILNQEKKDVQKIYLPQKIKLQGILFNQSKYQALLFDKLFKVGDNIHGYEVKEITEYFVVLIDKDKQRVTLYIDH